MLAAVSTAAIGLPTVLAAPPTPYPRPGETQRVSVSSSGAQAQYPPVFDEGAGCGMDGPGAGVSDISADGRYVAFVSYADNLVPGDTNRSCDIFRYDRVMRKIIRVSVATDGSQTLGAPGAGPVASARSSHPSISADGRYVAFNSQAINLAPGPAPGPFHMYVHDTQTHVTTWVSRTHTGGNPAVVIAPGVEQPVGGAGVMSPDGRFIAFQTGATNVVPGFKGGGMVPHVYVRDLRTGKVVLATAADRSSEPGNGFGGDLRSLSRGGRYVVFTSMSTNLVPGNTAGQLCQCEAPDVYVRDIIASRTYRVSVASDGSPASFALFPTCNIGIFLLCASGAASNGGSAISDDGRFVTFHSNATNLVPNDSNFTPPGGGGDAFVHDLRTRRTERVSVDAVGHEDQLNDSNVVISGNGRQVAYGSGARDPLAIPKCLGGIFPAPPDPTGLMSGDCSREFGTAYDRTAGAPENVERTTTGREPQLGNCRPASDSIGSFVGSLSYTGRHLSFTSSVSNLVAGDTNNACDFFVRDLGLQVGVGGLAETGKLSVAESASFAKTGVIAADGSAATLAPTLVGQGAELLEARAVYRRSTSDLFVRLDLTDMPRLTGAVVPGFLYGLRLTANGVRYEVRAQRLLGPDFDAKGGASFGLFRQDPTTGVFTRVATLKGGYGTVGEAVVTAVPLSALGLAEGGRLSNVTAFTAVGSYLTGPTQVLDSVRLSR